MVGGGWGGTLGMGDPLRINPYIYTLYIVGIYWVYIYIYISPLKGAPTGGVKQLGALHPKGSTIFSMKQKKHVQGAWDLGKSSVTIMGAT